MMAQMRHPNLGLVSDDEPARGMSDEEEMRRYGKELMDSLGIGGEVLVDIGPDLADLGLTPE